MKPSAYYINLTHRTDRNELMQQRWNKIVDLNRIDAIDNQRAIFGGVKGCFMSHVKAFETISKSYKFGIIMEDDIIPCSDFNNRLKLFLCEIPENWNVFMLGYSAHNRSEHEKVFEHIHQAKKWVGAGHCYIVNPKFYSEYQMLIKNPSIHENDFDIFLNYLQRNHKVYMAMPSFCYQYSSYSDNNGMVVGNTHYTETFFKDKLL